MLDCYFEVNKFKLQSRYYVHFLTNTLGKGIKPLIPQLCVKYYHCCCCIPYWDNHDERWNHYEGMNLTLSLQKYVSLVLLKGDWNFCSVCERERDRERKTHRGFEGLGHCSIDPYFLLSHVVPCSQLYLALLNHTVPHSGSGSYGFSSLTRSSQSVFVKGPLGLQDSRLMTGCYCCGLPHPPRQCLVTATLGTCVYIIS